MDLGHQWRQRRIHLQVRSLIKSEPRGTWTLGRRICCQQPEHAATGRPAQTSLVRTSLWRSSNRFPSNCGEVTCTSKLVPQLQVGGRAMRRLVGTALSCILSGSRSGAPCDVVHADVCGR